MKTRKALDILSKGEKKAHRINTTLVDNKDKYLAAYDKTQADIVNKQNSETYNMPFIESIRRKVSKVVAAPDTSLPIVTRFDIYSGVKKIAERSNKDNGLTRLAAHLEKIWHADPVGSLTYGEVNALVKLYKDQYPRSKAADAIEAECSRVGLHKLPVAKLARIANTIDSQDAYDAIIEANGLSGSRPEQVRARTLIRGLVAIKNGVEVDHNPVVSTPDMSIDERVANRVDTLSKNADYNNALMLLDQAADLSNALEQALGQASQDMFEDGLNESGAKLNELAKSLDSWMGGLTDARDDAQLPSDAEMPEQSPEESAGIGKKWYDPRTWGHASAMLKKVEAALGVVVEEDLKAKLSDFAEKLAQLASSKLLGDYRGMQNVVVGPQNPDGHDDLCDINDCPIDWNSLPVLSEEVDPEGTVYLVVDMSSLHSAQLAPNPDPEHEELETPAEEELEHKMDMEVNPDMADGVVQEHELEKGQDIVEEISEAAEDIIEEAPPEAHDWIQHEMAEGHSAPPGTAEWGAEEILNEGHKSAPPSDAWLEEELAELEGGMGMNAAKGKGIPLPKGKIKSQPPVQSSAKVQDDAGKMLRGADLVEADIFSGKTVKIGNISIFINANDEIELWNKDAGRACDLVDADMAIADFIKMVKADLSAPKATKSTASYQFTELVTVPCEVCGEATIFPRSASIKDEYACECGNLISAVSVEELAKVAQLGAMYRLDVSYQAGNDPKQNKMFREKVMRTLTSSSNGNVKIEDESSGHIVATVWNTDADGIEMMGKELQLAGAHAESKRVAKKPVKRAQEMLPAAPAAPAEEPKEMLPPMPLGELANAAFMNYKAQGLSFPDALQAFMREHKERLESAGPDAAGEIIGAMAANYTSGAAAPMPAPEMAMEPMMASKEAQALNIWEVSIFSGANPASLSEAKSVMSHLGGAVVDEYGNGMFNVELPLDLMAQLEASGELSVNVGKFTLSCDAGDVFASKEAQASDSVVEVAFNGHMFGIGINVEERLWDLETIDGKPVSSRNDLMLAMGVSDEHLDDAVSDLAAEAHEIALSRHQSKEAQAKMKAPKVNQQQPDAVAAPKDLGPDSEQKDMLPNPGKPKAQPNQPKGPMSDTNMGPDLSNVDMLPNAGKPKAQHPAKDQKGIKLPDPNMGEDSEGAEAFKAPALGASPKVNKN